MDTKVIELMNRHQGFLDANEISVLTKINYRKVKKDIEILKELKNSTILFLIILFYI